MATLQPEQSSDQDAARLVRDELAHEAARADAHARDVERCRGVSWSGLGPALWRPRSRARIEADALARCAARQAWRSGRGGRFLEAVATAQRAAAAAHLAGDAARAAVDRGLEDEEAACASAVSGLETQARALLAAVRAARRALASP